MIVRPTLGKCLAALLGAVCLVGCSPKEVNRPTAPGEEQLLKIGTAYSRAMGRLRRPPGNFEELEPDLQGTSVEDLRRSPNDGEPFVIIWGVDFNQFPPGRDDPHIVAGYEQRGVGGKRYVLRFPLKVTRMSQEELDKAVFPPGHKPPT